MSSERELDEGIKSIKSAWRREHTARTNLKRMLEQAEAENAKLKELVQDIRKQIGDADRINGRLVGENESLKAENEKLRELVRDMWRDGMCDCDEQYTCAECEYGYHKRMRELGIEVE